MAETKKDLEAIIAELKAENAELKKQVTKPEAKPKKTKEDKGMVSMFIPIIDGDTEDVTVGCNGVMYKIKKGVQVEVPYKVAVILQNSNKQAVRAMEYSDSVKMQELG